MAERRILVVAHAHRDDTVDAAVRVVDTLRRAGATPVMELADRTALAELAPVLGDVAVLGDDIRVDDLDAAEALAEVVHVPRHYQLGHSGLPVNAVLDGPLAGEVSVDDMLTLLADLSKPMTSVRSPIATGGLPGTRC